ncbi:substrate-binding periplasmic protein [Engelhardtia mirabilis]|uniref:Cystine-binding periplasmic protein n=1 Tax=Engelhardtia mirabilis TaxID=2528011 RepID=A0A518BG87_9BACT|nr:Cystine-binding periplasmic protein precursor [Planctomycetes bacterium Pla133]QDV00329.1 Cystine-binding periplasmic protein precursor [Planctomycetes bacterium Pla86]
MLRVALIAAAVACSLACSSPRSESDLYPGPPLVVGCDFANPPFASREGALPPVGRDVEMTRELARRLGRPLIWRQLPFDELLDAVEDCEVDAVVATMGVTPEREARVPFSEPYFVTDVLALVRVGDGQPRTLDELDGQAVAAGAGTTSERAVRLCLPNSTIAVASEKGDTSVDRLLAGEIAAAVMDGPDARDLARENPRLTWIEEPLAEERYAIALRPDDPNLRKEVDAALGAMREEGFLALLDQRFGLAGVTE